MGIESRSKRLRRALRNGINGSFLAAIEGHTHRQIRNAARDAGIAKQFEAPAYTAPGGLVVNRRVLRAAFARGKR